MAVEVAGWVELAGEETEAGEGSGTQGTVTRLGPRLGLQARPPALGPAPHPTPTAPEVAPSSASPEPRALTPPAAALRCLWPGPGAAPTRGDQQRRSHGTPRLSAAPEPGATQLPLREAVSGCSWGG